MTTNDLTVFDTEPDEARTGGEGGVLMLTNADFVDAVFSQLPEGAFAAVCSKAGDPCVGDQNRDRNRNSGGWACQTRVREREKRVYKIAVGEHQESNTIKNIDISWDKLAQRLSSHTITQDKGGKYLVGGHFSGTVRRGEYLIARTLLVLDVDSYPGAIDDLEFELSLWLSCAFVAYSSYQHTSDAPRVRLVIPLSRELSLEEYRVFAYQFCHDSILPFESFDECSWKPNQAMFLPQYPVGGECWTMIGEGDPLEVGEIDVPETVVGDDLDDLGLLLAAQPLDMSATEVETYLAAYPAQDLDYDAWLRVGMALYHQFEGSPAGFKAWVAWSALSDKHDDSTMKNKYKSFGGSTNPVTMASIIHHVKQSGGVVASGSFYDDLLVEAESITTIEQYTVFRDKIAAMSNTILPPVHRAGVVSEVAGNFGKSNGMPKGAFTKEMQASKVVVRVSSGMPEWLEPWVYIENTMHFANSDVSDYAIKREAFNAKYDREPECLAAQMPASQVALVDYQIRTVVDTMFYPGAGRFFTYEDKDMLNSFTAKGVVPDDVLSEQGKAAVELFTSHLDFTLENADEREIFLNWMAYIYQNPGKRVGWAMLLQGAQGSGKSYFGALLQELMGSNVQSLDTGAISGRFTGWATGALVTVVEEIRISGTSKYEILDKLKPIISNQTIQIEEKGRDHRTVPNFTSYLLLTNHKDAIPLSDGDRRYCAMFSRVQSEQQLFAELGGSEGARAYFDTLFESMRANAGALARFLLDRKIPASFDPNGRAPETAARLEMKDLSVSPDADMLENLIEMNRCEVISDTILDVTWLGKWAKFWGEKMPDSRRVNAILSEQGWSPIPKRRMSIAGESGHTIWIKGVADLEAVKKIVRDFHSRARDSDF